MFLTLLLALILGTASAAEKPENKTLVGKWKYEVPTAPYGYEKGTIEFEEKEGQLSGNVIFQDGYKIELKKITFEENVLNCGLYIDYEYVSIKAKVEGTKMSGTVGTPDGDMKITAEKTN